MTRAHFEALTIGTLVVIVAIAVAGLLLVPGARAAAPATVLAARTVTRSPDRYAAATAGVAAGRSSPR